MPKSEIAQATLKTCAQNSAGAYFSKLFVYQPEEKICVVAQYQNGFIPLMRSDEVGESMLVFMSKRSWAPGEETRFIKKTRIG